MKQEILPIIGIKENFMVQPLSGCVESNLTNELFRFCDGAFIVALQGELSLLMNLDKLILRTNQILTIPPHQVLQKLDISPDFNGYVILFRPGFVQDVNIFRSHMPYLVAIHEYPVLDLSDATKDLVLKFCEFLHEIDRNELVNHVPEIQKGLLASFFNLIAEIYRQIKPDSLVKKEKLSRSNYIFNKFLKLIVEYHTKERSVAFYADKLCITPKYLSTICREVSSKVATDLISTAVIMDAKSKLRSTSMTVQEISLSLNFPNPSFFGRYFKRYTGCSPMQFREKN